MTSDCESVQTAITGLCVVDSRMRTWHRSQLIHFITCTLHNDSHSRRAYVYFHMSIKMFLTQLLDSAGASRWPGGYAPPSAKWQAHHNKRFIIEEIITIVATRCQILRLKCTKSFVGWGSAPDPAGGAYSAPLNP